MHLIKSTAIAVIICGSTLAHASGPQVPIHAQLSYSFTCPSGASGHLSYTQDSAEKPSSQLSLWVNGSYIHSDSRLVTALHGKSIDQLLGGCEGEKTTVMLRVSDPGATATSALQWVTVLIDRTGKVVWVGA
jgi:hypothetical protein